MCDCKDFGKWQKGSIQDEPFKSMEKVSVNIEDWSNLVKCPTCGQLWQVDEWDKYHHGIGIKYFGDKDSWETIEDVEIRKEIIIENHNGLSSNECQWFGCKNKALGDMAFCVDHAYENGIRW